ALGAADYEFSSGEIQNPLSAIQERIMTIFSGMSPDAEASATLEADQYTVVVIDKLSQPLQLDNAPEPYIAHRYQLILNWETGAIQSEEFALQTSSGEWVTMESRTNFHAEIIQKLPANAAQTLEEAATLTQEE
ncbi:MAG: hypothetical protein WAM60_16660, partial [Candidatus Promineifilaceae bacterium]